MDTAPARYLRSSEEILLLDSAKQLCPNVDTEAICHLIQAAASMGAHNALLMLQKAKGGMQ